jgi:hypothetical protein
MTPTLSPEQKETVAGWVAAGDNLSQIQKKLIEHLKVSLTYMDVRFLVDDLNLNLKDAAPKLDTTLQKSAPPPPADPMGLGQNAPAPADGSADGAAELDPLDDLPAGGGNVTVAVDKVTLIPGAMASGTVTFGDGVTGKWIVDNYGRPGFTEVSKPDYRPTPADAQAFMQELSAAMQRRGM